MSLKILQLGNGLSFQDLGRPGWARYGIASAGAMDPLSHLAANEILSNHPNDPSLEIALGGAAFRVEENIWLAYHGGPICDDFPSGEARFFKKDDILRFHPSRTGLWGYLATPSGWQCRKQFGSHSRHERSDLGSAIQANEVIFPVQNIGDAFPKIARRFHTIEPHPLPPRKTLRLFNGPHEFPVEARQKLITSAWKISSELDRTGYRLEGPKIPSNGLIKSCPVLPGSIQITSGDQPIVTLNDGPTVGGYPLIALIHPNDLPHFVQHPPGTTIHFTWHEKF